MKLPKKHRWLLVPVAALLCALLLLLMNGSVQLSYMVGAFFAENKTAQTDAELFYYSGLQWSEQQLYHALSDAVDTLSASTENVPYQYTEEAFNDVCNAYLSDHPSCFYIARTGTVMSTDGKNTRIELAYLADAETISSMQHELGTAVQRILLQLPSGLDAYETARFLHDSICGLTEPPSAEPAYSADLLQSAYGALVLRTADSCGYATAYQLLMNTAGLYCEIVHGTVSGEVQTWNAIQSDEGGQRLFCDLVFDDSLAKEAEGLHFHGYFGLSYQYIMQDHIAAVPALWEDEAPATDDYTRRGLRLGDDATANTALLYAQIEASFARGDAELEIGFHSGEGKTETETEDALKTAVLAAIDRWNGDRKTPVLSRVLSVYCTSSIVGGYTVVLYPAAGQP